MENTFRAAAAGLIFHFTAGLITASIWRLTSARRALVEKCHRDSNPSDIFSEVMIWPLYLVLLFSLFIKSSVDLILKIGNCILQFSKKLRGNYAADIGKEDG